MVTHLPIIEIQFETGFEEGLLQIIFSDIFQMVIDDRNICLVRVMLWQ